MKANCANCGRPLEHVFPEYSRRRSDKQFKHALQVTLSGGYGMRIDPVGGEVTAFICSDCVDSSIKAMPWFAMLIGSVI